MNDAKQVALIILDGWGIRDDTKDNAIKEAITPFFDSLLKKYPHTTLDASEEHVGLPHGTIGNSEIGHMTMGAGRVIHTDLVRISHSIREGGFKNNSAFKRLFEHVKKHNSSLHVMGLASPIGVHSHQDHLHEFLKLAKEEKVEKIVIHVFTDGRDSPPQGSSEYLKSLEALLKELGIGYISTVVGRYYALDRDKNWNRTAIVEEALFEGKGQVEQNKTPSEVVSALHKKGMLDEHLEPIIFLDQNGKSYGIEKNDGVFFFNFRTDRPRQLCYKILERAKKNQWNNILLTTMTEYAKDIDSVVAFPPQKIENTLAETIANAGLSQVHIAETEKYAHVTYFFNGERPQLHPNEEHILIESRKDVRTHDEAPEMKAREIADAAIESINKRRNFILLNFANADIVGHTANKPAIKKAVETIDHELGRIVETLERAGGVAIITADHGNAEMNVDPKTGEMHTAHTTNKVPFIVTKTGIGLTEGTLADIAPTILELLELEQPKEMTGRSLMSTNGAVV